MTVPSPVAVAGPSPLARGLQELHALTGASIRIIPARAGFTLGPGTPRSFPRDHPRSRGVYGGSGRFGRSRRGSSPLARGLQCCPPGRSPSTRIIPARAGFTVLSTGQVTIDSDHPRSRGVYGVPGAFRHRRQGSSPLARGLRRAHKKYIPGDRIIPARAGFTDNPSAGNRCATDHPRSRGVYRSPISTLLRRRGSSPLARGLRSAMIRDILNTRIIPARAGFTAVNVLSVVSPADHPRSRGVYSCNLE